MSEGWINIFFLSLFEEIISDPWKKSLWFLSFKCWRDWSVTHMQFFLSVKQIFLFTEMIWCLQSHLDSDCYRTKNMIKNMRLCFPSTVKCDTVKVGVISYLTTHPQSHLCNTLTDIKIIKKDDGGRKLREKKTTKESNYSFVVLFQINIYHLCRVIIKAGIIFLINYDYGSTGRCDDDQISCAVLCSEPQGWIVGIQYWEGKVIKIKTMIIISSSKQDAGNNVQGKETWKGVWR